MTLIVALRGRDGLVLAADSRGTFGDPRGVTAQNDAMVKVFQLAKRVGVLMAGDAGIGNNIIAQWPHDLTLDTPVSEVVQTFRLHVQQKMREWFPGFAIQALPNVPQPVRPNLSFIVAGYGTDHSPAGMAQADVAATDSVIYYLPGANDFAPGRNDFGFALEGVPQYALYLLNRLYRQGESVAQLQSLAAYAITETASQDGKVGGPVRMAAILADRGYEAIPDEGVRAVVDANVARSEQLRRSFFGEVNNVR